MQKKIIALAIAAALTAPALAFAEATVYGQVNLAVERMNDGNSPGTTSNQLNSYGSRFGARGSEALDGGMSAIWELEGSLEADTGASNLFGREANLGLTSDSMGTVRFGRRASPYKLATRRLDMFGDTAADTRGSVPGPTPGAGITMMGNGHDISPANTISYTSPSMSGFSVVAATLFGAESAGAASTKGSLVSLAGMFEQGPIYATVAYDTVKAGSSGSGDLGAGGGNTYNLAAVDNKATAFKVGGSYTMDAFAVNAVVERIKNTIAIGSVESTGTNLYLAGKFNVSSTDAVKAAYTKRGNTTGATNNATQIAVGYDHGMSKNTMVYALYTKVTQKATGAADPSVLSVGIKHSF